MRPLRSRQLLALVLSYACAAAAGPLETVSVTTIAVPQEANGSSRTTLAVSPDGRYALFRSEADNLVPGDTNHAPDLFLHDASGDSVERVSLGSGGVQADAAADYAAAISDDGRYVVFGSSARNLAAGATQGYWQIYVRDRVAGSTALIGANGGAQPFPYHVHLLDASADARHILFSTELGLVPADTNDLTDIYRLDRNSGQYALVTAAPGGQAANRDSSSGQMSADGRVVAFASTASNLIANDTDNSIDIFLRDIDAGTTELASRLPSGQPAGPGSYVTFPRGNAVSDDGRYVVFNCSTALEPSDTNGADDGYRYDRNDASVRRVTLAMGGAQIEERGGSVVSLSADGATVTFESTGIVLPGQSVNFTHSYRLALSSMAPEEIVLRPWIWGDDVSTCVLSGNAQIVQCEFLSNSWLATAFNDFSNVYRVDPQAATVRRVSRPLPQPAAYADHDSGVFSASVSGDGRFVVFESLADNLVVGDFNGARDLFLRDRLTGTTTRVNRHVDGGEGRCTVNGSAISADGRYIAYDSCDVVVPGVANGYLQVYRQDRVTGDVVLVSQNAAGEPAASTALLGGISADGSVVSFFSWGDNLVAEPNPSGDVFVRDVAAGSTRLVSRRPGTPPSGWAGASYLSADGRYVAFTHSAADLVDGDTNGFDDVFVYDRMLGQIDRVSVDAGGGQLDGYSAVRGISRDGGSVLFYTLAPVLVGDNFIGEFVRDRASGAVELVSRNNAGAPLRGHGDAVLSADGNLVAMTLVGGNDGLASPPLRDYDGLFVFDRRRARLQLLTPGDVNGNIVSPQFSDDGRHIVFWSRASNLVAGAGNNRFADVFLARDFLDYLFADGFDPSP